MFNLAQIPFEYHIRLEKDGVRVVLRPYVPVCPPQVIFMPYTGIFFEHKPTGGGHYIWDVNKAAELCRTAPGVEVANCQMPPWTPEEIDVQYEGGVDKEYAAQTDTERPVVFVTMPDGTHTLIDGWHRFYRTAKEGGKYIYGYILPPGLSAQCLLAELPPGCPTLEQALAGLEK